MLIINLFLVISFSYFVTTPVKAWRPFQIKITNVSSKSYVDFLEMNSSISTNGALSLYINAVQDVSNLHAKVVILVLSSSGNYDLVLANTTVDVCEFYRNKKYVPILQMFYRTFTKTGTFPKSCPIRKNLYLIKDVVIDPEDFPPVFPTRKGFGDITLMSKNGNKAKLLGAFTVHAESNPLNKTKK